MKKKTEKAGNPCFYNYYNTESSKIKTVFIVKANV